MECLGEAKAALAKLHGRYAVLPNQEMLISTISLQEAKQSSEIENIFTTDDDLYHANSKNDLNKAEGSPKEVLRYREATIMACNHIRNPFHGFNHRVDIEYLK